MSMEKEITLALAAIDRPGIILYPTDTIWGIGCRASDPVGVQRIYELKRRPSHKAMLCLVSGFEMLQRYAGSIPTAIESLISSSDRPTTVIYPRVEGVDSALLGDDGSLGIRVTSDPFCMKLIHEMGEALVSTSANLSGEPSPTSFSAVSPAILAGVDYIVNLRRNEINTAPSRILRVLQDGSVEVIRE